MTASDHLKQATGSLGGDQVTEEAAEALANAEYQPHRFGDTPAWFAACVRLAKRTLTAEAALAQKTRECETLQALAEEEERIHAADREGWANDLRKSKAQVEQLGRQVADPVTDEEWAKYHGWIVNMLEDDDDREPFQYACMNRQELDKFIASRARTK